MLHFQKEGWWWKSRHNIDRKRDATEAMNYGSALHAIMLEGVAAYEARFAVEPDPRTYRRVLYKIDDYKDALKEAGFDLAGSSGWKTQNWLDACAVHLPAGIVAWDNVMAVFAKARGVGTPSERRAVSAAENRALRIMYDAAINAEGPEGDDIRQILGSGAEVPPLAELSFFWTDRFGIRRRARFDKPVPWFTLDLKSLGNWQGRELTHAVGDHILKGGYDIQVGDQHMARLIMHRMIQDLGDAAIFGGTLEERAWLHAIATRNLPFEWWWLFYQKPEPTGRAPILFPLNEAWRGPYHQSGHRKAVRAIGTYVRCVEKFGLAKPWTRIEPPHYVNEAKAKEVGVKPLTPPHYGWDDDPVPDEDTDLAR